MGINLITSTLVKRYAPYRGARTSDSWNDTIDELAIDIGAITGEWNSKLQPLLRVLPDGSVDPTLNAFINGLDGSQMYLDHDATEFTDNGAYWDSTSERPLTVKESFHQMRSDMEDTFNTLSVLIESTTHGLSYDQKLGIGIEIFADDYVFPGTSIYQRGIDNRYNAEQIAKDLYGPSFTLAGTGDPILTNSIKNMTDALLEIHLGDWSDDITLAHWLTDADIADNAAIKQTKIDNSVIYNDSFVGTTLNLQDDLNQIRTVLKDLKGTPAWTTVNSKSLESTILFVDQRMDEHIAGYTSIISGGPVAPIIGEHYATDVYVEDFYNEFDNSNVEMVLHELRALIGVGGGGGGDLPGEELLYRNLLDSLPYAECYFDIFSVDSTVTLGGSPLPTYDSGSTSYSGNNGSEITKKVVDASATTYYRFYVHSEQNNDLIDVEYSFNGSTWIALTEDDTVYIEAGFTDLWIKYKWTGTDTLFSFGILYDFSINFYTTDTRMWETLDPGTHTAPYQITLPNNAAYTVDGKSLELYMNRVRLTNGVDFTEDDDRNVTMQIDVQSGDTLLFTEKFGYVDLSNENTIRLDLEHDATGLHSDATVSVHGFMSASDKTKLDSLGVTGIIVNSASIIDATLKSGTNVIPIDNTIPQQGEGNLWMTLTYAPLEIGNKLIIRTCVHMESWDGSAAVVAIFKDSDSNAIGVGHFPLMSYNGVIRQVEAYAEATVLSLSTITFKVEGAISTTTYFNGDEGLGFYGGTLNSYIEVFEVKA